MDNKQKKMAEYAMLINEAVAEMIEEKSLSEELGDSENLTTFIHALATVAPTHFYNSVTGDEKQHLQFNHMANQLCFQYMKKQNDGSEN